MDALLGKALIAALSVISFSFILIAAFALSTSKKEITPRIDAYIFGSLECDVTYLVVLTILIGISVLLSETPQSFILQFSVIAPFGEEFLFRGLPVALFSALYAIPPRQIGLNKSLQKRQMSKSISLVLGLAATVAMQMVFIWNHNDPLVSRPPLYFSGLIAMSFAWVVVFWLFRYGKLRNFALMFIAVPHSMHNILGQIIGVNFIQLIVTDAFAAILLVSVGEVYSGKIRATLIGASYKQNIKLK